MNLVATPTIAHLSPQAESRLLRIDAAYGREALVRQNDTFVVPVNSGLSGRRRRSWLISIQNAPRHFAADNPPYASRRRNLIWASHGDPTWCRTLERVWPGTNGMASCSDLGAPMTSRDERDEQDDAPRRTEDLMREATTLGAGDVDDAVTPDD